MTKFLDELKLILSQYKKSGVNDDYYGGIAKRYRYIILEKLNNPTKWNSFSNFFSAFIKAVPLVAGLSVSLVLHFYGKEIALLWGILFAFLYLLFLFMEYKLPKDWDALKSEINSLEIERVIQILAAQVTLYSSLQEISHDDDDEHIEMLSSIINEPLLTALNGNSKTLKKLIKNKSHNDILWNSAVHVKDLPKEVFEALVPVAEMISDACRVFFGPAKYSAKIYLRTKHLIPIEGKDEEVELMTSLAKYPPPQVQSKNFAGRSWLNCRGSVAEVWNSVNGYNEVICKQNEPKRENPVQYYPSIAFIKLPYGLGVLTIESSETSTFGSTNDISDDIKECLMTVTNALVRQSLSKINV